MNYWQLTLKTDKNNIDLITEVLYGLDAISIDFSDSFDNPILEPKIGTTPLWNDITLKVLFNEDINKNHINKTIAQICNIFGDYEFIADRNWQNECMKDFKATLFGDNLWICPSWHNDKNLKGVIVKMDPGMAFGTGSHQTTAMCLEYLAQNPPINKTVIDFGTGSGILAITAKKLGSNDTYGVDIDSQALISSIENAKKNNVAILLSEKMPNTKVDLIIANILANPLIKLCEQLSNAIITGGTIVLSGILNTQKQLIINTYEKYFNNLEVSYKDEWLLITGVKK